MKRLLSAFLFAVLLSGFVQAQGGISSAGREFYLGMVLPSFNAQNLPLVEQGVLKYYAISALVSSTTDNSIRVSYFDANGNETTPTVYLVGARKAIQIPLDTSRMKPNTLGEAPEYKTCHIISQSPVSIEFFSIGACSGGSYLALPIQCWGKDYVVESYHDNPNGLGGIFSKEKSRGFFQVIAAYDNTSVTITPNTTTSRGKPGVNTGAGSTGVLQPFQISLNRGQTYTVFSSGGDISDDISGSQVKSNKQVAVLGGHENAFTDASNIGSTQLEARDYMIDQMMPIGNWDTAGYYNLPLVDSKPPVQGGEGDEYHVFTGSPNGSNITLNSNIQRDVSLHTTLYPNPVVGKLSITTPVELSETYPGGIFHVVQYDQAMQGSGSPYPRPSMISIVPRSRWSSEYTFQVPNSTFEILQGYFTHGRDFRLPVDS